MTDTGTGEPLTGRMICCLHAVDERDVDRVGGKGAKLGRLLRLGLPVPPGFVITTDAYRAILAAPDLAQATPDQRRARLPTTPLPDDISAAILDAYGRLAEPAVAVRSSGTAEDLAAASFAGQHDTFLNVVGPDALLAAVRGCWASLWSERAVAYRRAQGWDAHDVALAVVVQAMVPAEWAGVLFTADPVSGRRDRLVVEAVSGLGEALVSGQATPSHAVIEKASLRLLAGDAPLPVEALEELARLGLRIDGAFDQPQDIEWAYAAGRCVILQARPLTALPASDHEATTTPEQRYSRLQRLMAPNALDHMPRPPYPFDYTLFFRPLMQRTLQALRSLGFATPAVEETFLTVADGVVQEVPPALRPTVRALKLPLTLLRARRANLEDWLEECRATLVDPARQIDGEDLLALSEHDLLARIATLGERQVALTVQRFGYLVPALLRSQGLGILLHLAVGREAARLQTDLLAAVPCVTTAANRELARLARLILGSDELRLVFQEDDPERIPSHLGAVPGGQALVAELDAFLRRYGYRESSMPGAALPAWRDQPSVVYGLLKGLVAAGPNASLDTGDGQRADRAERELRAALATGWFGFKRRLLPHALRQVAVVRSVVAFREDSHFYLFLPFTVIRHLALELGRRLVARGDLDAADDIFFLELAEIDGRVSGAGVRETVRRRTAARQEVAGRYIGVPAALLEQSSATGDVRGAAASPGTATGRVRIILDERDFWRLLPGEVLVAPYTNPSWTPLFAVAGAVVVDAGGVASHAAIVAREYGIPAVMGTGTATRVLRDGQRVVVDGTRGRVVSLGDDAAQAALG